MRKLKRYVVGFDQDRQCIYGKDRHGKVEYADPMTLSQAKRKLRELNGRPAKAIYKLVPVKVPK